MPRGEARDLFHIGRLKRRLIAGPLPNPVAFFYFFVVTVFDGVQLAILDSTSHSPGPWGPPAVWASFAVVVVFLVLAYCFNGGAAGSPGGGTPGLRAS